MVGRDGAVVTARSGRWLVAVLALLVIGACVVGPIDDAPAPSDPGSPATPLSPGGPPPDANEFETDVRSATTVAEQYWRAQFAAAGERFAPIRRIIAYQRTGQVSCGGEPLGRNNAAYCTAGDFIAYDVNWAVAAFEQLGDAFLYFLLGHEYAHGVQVRLGLRYSLSIEQELQADCMAGAYIGDSVRAGRLLLEDGDLEELRAGLVVVGDDPGQPWFAEGAHGDAGQRTAAFFAGYQRSIGACDLPTG